MFAAKHARRIVIIVDATLISPVLEKLTELGVKGYNCVESFGKGLHAVTGDPFTKDDLVRIEIIASDQVASDVLNYVHAAQFAPYGNYALAAYMDTVEVDLRDKSLV